MDFDDLLADLQQAHNEELQAEFERGSDAGYADGFNDGQREGDQKAQALRDELLEKLAQLRLGAELPLPLNGTTLTLEEIEQMIKEG